MKCRSSRSRRAIDAAGAADRRSQYLCRHGWVVRSQCSSLAWAAVRCTRRAKGSCWTGAAPVLDGTAEHHGASTLACRRLTTILSTVLPGMWGCYEYTVRTHRHSPSIRRSEVSLSASASLYVSIGSEPKQTNKRTNGHAAAHLRPQGLAHIGQVPNAVLRWVQRKRPLSRVRPRHHYSLDCGQHSQACGQCSAAN